MLSILANGHILIEDNPGLAKTLMAKSFAAVLGLEFRRVQFTPDLLPADITGTYILNRNTSQFELRRGPIFTNILLADEINRAPPRTQSALLEAMQEKQVTIEGDTQKLQEPFIVIATQNPIEYEGTYPLPEAQLDRFLVRLSVGYPSAEEEAQIIERRNSRRSDDVRLEVVSTRDALIAMQAEVEGIHAERAIIDYIVAIVRGTRSHSEVEIGSSPRGSLAITKLAKANAWMNSRHYVIPDDVKRVAVPALSHRLILKPEGWLRGDKTASIVDKILQEVPVPKVD
ncbi:MAG: MoxR family ATPase [Nitrososphaerota archaeon]|nr:MoxR family ATPase [Nitrososphaerota archaeon]MDG6919680.1 MoxR family ATPase [Nitrososphaerota archaeon]MDG6920977.1 MoxR family ATPase [Nitrososphaerota archaeon]MDG6941245.1 MoxR family ATPase [Nitrososphaerota archaeon]MDG6951505.1 MoxR family ATPase [Nitrososphaerota archaeon]